MVLFDVHTRFSSVNVAQAANKSDVWSLSLIWRLLMCVCVFMYHCTQCSHTSLLWLQTRMFMYHCTQCSHTSPLWLQTRMGLRYSEGGNPCIESPLAAANSLQEMLLSSWGGRTHVFPGVPDGWQDAAFSSLLAEGAFEVSALFSSLLFRVRIGARIDDAQYQCRSTRSL
jgi:hypothetical protein